MTIGTPTFYPAGPIEIRDGTVAAVKTVTGFANVFGNRVAPTKSEQLPLACVWHAGDRTEPWGDANVGAPSFDHTLSMAVDIMVAAGTEDQLNADIVLLMERVRAALLTDPDWVNLSEAVTRADATYSYPQEGTFAYARGVIEFELKFRSEWEPALPNALTSVVASYPPATAGPLMSVTLPGAAP